MLEFLGTVLGYLLALVIFGLMLAVAVVGFRKSEKAVKDHDRNRPAHTQATNLP
jgi:Mn2+/Fe2+ NRAMP family transporter